MLSLSLTNSKEDPPRQSNANESLLPTTSSENEYAALSLSMTDSWEDTQSQTDIDESLSPATASDNEYSDLSLSMTDSWEDIENQIDIDEIFSRTTLTVEYAERLTTLLDLHKRPRLHMSLRLITDLETRILQEELRMNTRRGVQSGNNRTFPEDSHRTGVSEVGTVPKSLLKLSTDLILEIADYLPPSSYMSLSYTCQRIRNSMGASIKYVLGDKVPMGRWKASAPSIEMRNIRSLERLEWRRMLDRDGKIPSPLSVCSDCLERHDRSHFAIKSLIKPSRRRRCLGGAGLVWICPHRTLDVDQVEYLKRFKLAECRGRHFKGVSSFNPKCSMFSGDSIFTQWPIMPVSPSCQPSNQEVKEALRPLNAPICPHLRLNNAKVASLYFQDCRRLRKNYPELDCQCLICLSGQRFAEICGFCGAGINFTIRYEINGWGALMLAIRRFIKTQNGDCTDPEWICHVADPADFKEYEESWHAAAAECWRKLEPVAR